MTTPTDSVTFDMAVVAAVVYRIMRISLAGKERPDRLLQLEWTAEILGTPMTLTITNNTDFAVGTALWTLKFRARPLGEHETDLPLGETVVHFGCKSHLLAPRFSGDATACQRDLTNMRVMLPMLDESRATSQIVTFPRESAP